MDLYGAPSSRTDRALWTFEEAGAAFTFHRVNLQAGEHRSDDFLKINPNGKVPVLVNGDLVLSESAAICTYIANQHPSAALVPTAGTADRARFEQWMYWCMSELEQPLWNLSKHRFVLPEKLRIPAMLDLAATEWKRPAAVLAAALRNHPYLVGDSFTVADIMVAQTLLWARVFEVELGHDVLETYLDRQIARPAFAKAQKYRR